MLLLQSGGDLPARHGAEELAALAALRGHLHLQALELFCDLCGGGLSLRIGLGLGLLLQAHGVHGVCRGQHSQALGQQKVPGVALGYLDHLALLTLASHIGFQNNFHLLVPPWLGFS